jgi:3-phenylpropionate/trans-cinnamate dioxygenase ferredoxin reductase subunit
VKAAVGVNAGRDIRFARRFIEQGKVVADARLADTTVPLAKL